MFRPLRRLAAPIAALALALATAAPTLAILDGQLDTEHPYVGGLVTQVGTQQILICSGTLISPTVFVTASHCTALLDELELPAGITLDPSFVSGESVVYWGETATNPGWDDFASFPNTYDVSVVVLDGAGVPTSVVDEYGALPEEGLLDRVLARSGKSKTFFTVVGYGASSYTRGVDLDGDGDSQPEQVYDDKRRVTTVQAIQMYSKNEGGFQLRHSGNGGQGRGASCNGDSGGPVFLNDTNIIVAVTSWGIDPNCAGPGWTYRLDTDAALDYLAPYAN
jgi:hypothetical protein